MAQTLCIPLRDIVNGYKTEWRRLHPFERVVADLTARARQKRDGLTLSNVLVSCHYTYFWTNHAASLWLTFITAKDDIHEARKELLEASKDWVAAVKSAETARDAGEVMQQGQTRLLELFQELAASPVSQILDLQRSLRSAPAVRLDTPAVVLVGAPNVGKSSIVRAISSGSPEVNNYPFTTRGMTLGHVEVFWSDSEDIAGAVVPDSSRKVNQPSLEVVSGRYAFSQLCQVMDSPGLLVRPDAERNEMEALTLAAMQHLPTAVMYVMDLSGGAGDKCSSIEDQLKLRREVRPRQCFLCLDSSSVLSNALVSTCASHRYGHASLADRGSTSCQSMTWASLMGHWKD
jgi:nucleolar GTP-binding protein